MELFGILLGLWVNGGCEGVWAAWGGVGGVWQNALSLDMSFRYSEFFLLLFALAFGFSVFLFPFFFFGQMSDDIGDKCFKSVVPVFAASPSALQAPPPRPYSVHLLCKCCWLSWHTYWWHCGACSAATWACAVWQNGREVWRGCAESDERILQNATRTNGSCSTAGTVNNTMWPIKPNKFPILTAPRQTLRNSEERVKAANRTVLKPGRASSTLLWIDYGAKKKTDEPKTEPRLKTTFFWHMKRLYQFLTIKLYLKLEMKRIENLVYA